MTTSRFALAPSVAVLPRTLLRHTRSASLVLFACALAAVPATSLAQEPIRRLPPVQAPMAYRPERPPAPTWAAARAAGAERPATWATTRAALVARPGTWTALRALGVARPERPAKTAGTWEELVRSVKIGRRVGVWLTDSTVVKGDLLSIDDHSITVSQPAGPRVVQAGEVTRVRYLTHASRNAFLAGLVTADALCVALESGSAKPQPVECLDIVTVFIGLPVGGLAAAFVRSPDLYAASALLLAPR